MQIDFNEAENQEQPPLPKGRYRGMVTAVMDHLSSDKKRSLKVEVAILDDDWPDYKITTYMSPFRDAKPFMRIKFANLCRACGIQGELGDTDNLLNIPIIVTVDHETYQGSTKATIKGFSPESSVGDGGSPRGNGQSSYHEQFGGSGQGQSAGYEGDGSTVY